MHRQLSRGLRQMGSKRRYVFWEISGTTMGLKGMMTTEGRTRMRTTKGKAGTRVTAMERASKAMGMHKQYVCIKVLSKVRL